MNPRLTRRSVLAVAGAAALLPWSPRANATTRNPVVHPDRTVTFRFTAPAAASVVVRGGWGRSFDYTEQPLRRGPGGTWQLTTDPLTPSYYQYSFLVDGVETKDPANPTAVHSSPALSLFLVPGRETDFLTVHAVPHGRVGSLTYHSRVTGTRRTAAVWTPPGHHRAPLPTLYLLHGGGGDHLDWLEPGRAPVILDNLLAAGRIRPMLVVFPDGNVPGATGLPGDDSFPAELLDNLVPAVEAAHRVRRDPRGRALAGLSLGGLQTWNFLLSRPGAVGAIGDFSSGYFPEVLTALTAEHADLLRDPRVNTGTELHHVYCGNPDDIAYANNVATRAVLTEFGIRHQYTEFAPGAHTWQTWRANLHDFAQRLFRVAESAKS
ncbi:alpha/beta hydrolase [Amycolatopsis magusensis]|uniref:alpha/beta hydrolase n=1 Tax=Amycolatopsis magusensis TaxID=882444 RepID=UPI0024A8FDAD|nr:alpha/beta hydrolase-fold protein [Amycolatopsis magusensis]MDI5975075.1 alpha/beta hydrolase-fold protein [Amycolatopsis magusensis]